MDLQVLFNIAVGVAAFLGGWVLNVVWAETKTVREKVSAIEVLVAGKYVTREEMSVTVTALFTKLDAISDKLSSKADK